MRYLLLAAAVAIAVPTIGCKSDRQRVGMKALTSTPITFWALECRFNGASGSREYFDGRRVYSGLLFVTGSPNAGVTATRDGQTALLVGDTRTVIEGRPLIFVDPERILLVPGWNVPTDMHDPAEIEKWCAQLFESARGTELGEELQRFAIARDGR